MTAESQLARVQRLRDVGVASIAIADLYRRIDADYFRRRSAQQTADDEATIAGLEAENAVALAELQRLRRADRLARYDVPLTSADADLIARDALTETRSLRAARRWLEGDRPLLLLCGPPGRGKTVAATAALLRTGGRYVRAGTLARLFLATFGAEVAEREALTVTAGLLVVDDVGTERSAEPMGVALVEMLDARRRGQRSIWITNLARSDFEQRYPDARLHSRLAQSALWCVDAGPDLRRGK